MCTVFLQVGTVLLARHPLNTPYKLSEHTISQDSHHISSPSAIWLPLTKDPSTAAPPIPTTLTHTQTSEVFFTRTRRSTMAQNGWHVTGLLAWWCLFPSLWAIVLACLLNVLWLQHGKRMCVHGWKMSSHSPQLEGQNVCLWQPHCKLSRGPSIICAEYCSGTVDLIHPDSWLSKTCTVILK